MDSKADRIAQARAQEGKETEGQAQEGGDVQTVETGPTLDVTERDVNGAEAEVMLELDRAQGEDDPEYGHRLNKEIESLVVEENESVYNTGKRLFIIMSENLYQEDSFNKYLASGRTTAWGRSKAYEVISQVQDFILGKVVKIDQERLDRVGWRKIQEIHGAVRNGIIGIDDALASAGTLSVQDLIKERLDWVLADARKRGLSPTVLQACQTCTFLRTFDPAQQMAKLGLWLADIDEPFEDEGDGSVREEYKVRGTPIRLQATECSYCVKRNIGLALGKPLSRSRGLAYGEACTFYEEAI